MLAWVSPAFMVGGWALQSCVIQLGKPSTSLVMLVGVRIGGSPIFPATFRWGYGWAYPRWYGDLTDQEQWQVEKKSAEIPAPLLNTVYPRIVQDGDDNPEESYTFGARRAPKKC